MARPRREKRITTIQITEETRDELKSRGKKGETYDDIIRKLLKARRNLSDHLE
jgi:predicted CopG family antitoxin